MSVIQLQNPALGAPAAPREADCVVGPWRLVWPLGQGHWSVVYQAQPVSAADRSQANYAIKVLREEFTHDRQAISQFQQEARLAKLVTHPNLQCVLSARVDKPPFYLVMPYQQGLSLRACLDASPPLPLATSLWITRQIAEALGALHEQGWVHCDLKPDNVHISSSGHATLCDLGLAQSREGASARSPALVGTLMYLPPEAFCADAQMTSARDIYALGVTLFEMLTRQRPFPQLDAAELAAAHRIIRPPDVRSIRPDVPAPVAHLLRSLLAKEPLRRPSGQELVKALFDLELDCFELRRAG